MKKLLAVLFIICLTGCAQIAAMQAQQQAAQEAQTQQVANEIKANEESRCASIRAGENTKNHYDCMQRERDRTVSILMAAMAQQNQQNIVVEQPAVPLRPLVNTWRPSVTTNCVSSPLGRSVYTNCY